jgi:hypothetical protein
MRAPGAEGLVREERAEQPQREEARERVPRRSAGTGWAFESKG